MHPFSLLRSLALYPWLAALPALGGLCCVLLWRGVASPQDPSEAQTARSGFAATALAYTVLLLVVGALALGSRGASVALPAVAASLALSPSVLLMGCVVAVLASSLGLALILSNTSGRLRSAGGLLSLFALMLAGVLGYALFSTPGA